MRVQDGSTYFSRVEVEITPGGAVVEVVDALPEEVDTSNGEVNRLIEPAWVSAALDGIRDVLSRAGQNGPSASGCRAALVRLIGTVADTREDVIRCAAGLAAWNALGADSPAPEAVFDGRRWVLQYPAPIPAAADGVTS
jgi:hypothetical protein